MARPSAVSEVELHPLVLLSVVDHYYRVAKDTNKRVVGVLLGEYGKGGHIDVTNSFAVPFEEQAAAPGGDKGGKKGGGGGEGGGAEADDDGVFFFDHSYLGAMYAMFKKVNARERVVGWYSTGRMRPSDLAIHDLVQPFCDEGLPAQASEADAAAAATAASADGGALASSAPPPLSRPCVFVTCDVRPAAVGLPFAAYAAVDEARADGTERSRRAFCSVPVRVGQTEAEAVGVEHLLRDVRDATLSELSADVGAKLSALQGLSSRLAEVRGYLDLVVKGKLPLNQDVLALLQGAYGLLPNLQAAPLGRALATQSNDMMAALYSASLARSVLALHRLIDNKERRLWAERERAARETAARAKKAAAALALAAGDKDKDKDAAAEADK